MGSLDLLTVGWIAGIIEGEGCFGLYQDKRRPNTSTDKDVIDRLHSYLGGRVWESNYPAKYRAFPNAKPSWRWNVSSKKEVKKVIDLIYAQLSIRRKTQATKLLDHIA